jgi:RNA polymerase sigma-70 factor (ECF subfamily)
MTRAHDGVTGVKEESSGSAARLDRRMCAESAALALPRDRAPARTFEDCYQSYSRDVYRIALRYGGGRRAFAEDVTQDVFVKLVQHLDEIDDVAAWLYRVAAHVAISHLRREQSLFTRARRAWSQQRQLVDPPQQESLEMGEQARAALARLRTLPPRERVIVCMKTLDGKTQREIAQALSLSEGYVSKLLTRAWERILDDRGVDDANEG